MQWPRRCQDVASAALKLRMDIHLLVAMVQTSILDAMHEGE
jgi:hypothetical protein